ncbi:long-chain fatty acid--CoA ligase [Cryobacterium glaciale]|uniref:Long-chain fatty acid--CoA ligase n=1 Tax=Cryobacterium glaciale TaxID=1259145 RepID=A0A4R8UV16_9MICO|nr:AMP-binding protein [Cryobacterium glaciale]TFB72725.1 long-chain fatty acid--CoA ligase [Cryobacterium glaciale]
MPFVNRLQHWAQVQPQATAVEVGADRLSFAELRDRAASQVGVEPALTALCLPNGIEFAVAFAAAVAGSGVCAVLDPGWPDAQRSAVEERLRGYVPGGVIAGSTRGSRGETGAEFVDGPADSVFLLGFTSGTTSLPKAFTRVRRSWQYSFDHSTGFFGLTRADRTLVPGPLSASLSLFALAESLHAGAAFFALPSFDVGAAIACVTERRITRIVSAPAALRLISERGLASGADGTALSGIVSAGAKLDAVTLALVRRWAPNATVYEYYGAAELSYVTAAALRPGDTSEAPGRSATAVGRALPGVDIRILDPDGHEQPAGVPGAIFVRSPLVSDGYAWGDDGEAFRRDGDWCTVGDEGFLDADAVLHHQGRRADMIITSGHNVYPHEVEVAMQDVPGVRTIIVTGLPDPHRGTRLVAAVIGSGEADAASLRSASATLLAGPKRPRAWFALAEAPVTATGKISRRLLSQWILAGDDRVRHLG